MRLLPQWYADTGNISLYYPSRSLLPAETRAFIDFFVERFQRERLDRRFAANPGPQDA